MSTPAAPEYVKLQQQIVALEKQLEVEKQTRDSLEKKLYDEKHYMAEAYASGKSPSVIPAYTFMRLLQLMKPLVESLESLLSEDGVLEHLAAYNQFFAMRDALTAYRQYIPK